MGMVDYERPATIPGGRARYDLERIGALLEMLGNPHLGVPTVHVAGTKGKGSTTALVASILNAAGLSTGLFTSPHLHTFRERIRVGGRPIPEAEFAMLVEALWPAVEEMRRTGHGRVTVFELLTAMAFCCFRDRGVGAQVIEVGLGGRLDSTNVVQPLACGITSLGLDHTEVLGDTLAEIAMEKAGIIKRGVPVVCSPQRPEALRVVRDVCEAQGSSLTLAGEDLRWSSESATLDGRYSRWRRRGARIAWRFRCLGSTRWRTPRSLSGWSRRSRRAASTWAARRSRRGCGAWSGPAAWRC